jgi:serine/threonine-protein kinase RsbW
MGWMPSDGHPGLERLERRLGPRTRGRVASIALGAVLGVAGVALGVLLHVVTSGASYAQLVGAVALAMVLGGVSAAVAATVVGWGVGSFLLENPDWQPVFADRDEFLRWSTSLLAAVVVVGVGWTMRRGHERAAVAAVEAERSRRRLEAIQELTASLSAAVRPADVAEALAGGVVEALGARSGSFGLVEGADLVVVESRDGTGRLRSAPVRLPLGARTPLAAAARQGHVVWVERRAELVRAFPDASSRDAASVLAVPVRRGADVIGAMAFVFRETGAVTLERRAVATLAAELGGQALERARLYELERLEAERTGRLQSLTAALAESLVPADVAAIVREQGIGTAGADAVAIHLVSESGEALELEGASGVDTTGLEALGRVPLERNGAVATAFSRGRASFHPTLETLAPDDPLLASAEEEGLLSVALFPLGVSRRVHGVLLLGWRTAQALPEVEGVTFAARYLPGESGVDVGGDWYDAFLLAEGRIALVVGDVVGKGVDAAATMGQLRNSLRAFASEHEDPAEVVRRLSDMVEAQVDAPFATLAYLVLDLHDRRCRYVVAGHPPPLLVEASGSARYLDDGRTLPLGVDADATLEVAETTVEPGATVVLYTDGLVERRDAPLDVGLELVRETAGSVAGGPDTLVDHVLRRVFDGTERYDDVAILAARLEPVGADVLDLRLPADRDGLRQMRTQLGVWLGELGARPEVRHDVLLAAREACANAVEHAQGPASATFGLHAQRDGQVLRLRVGDSGRWRAPGSAPPDRGLGLPLMRGLMDRVDIVHAAGGTVVVLERRLDGTQPADRSRSSRVFADTPAGTTQS